MSHRVIGLVWLALSAAGLAGCGRTEAPAPAQTPAPASAASEAASQAAYEAGADLKPSDPVGAFVWRAGLCGHLSGEIGGDRSARDAQVQKRMGDLGCGDDLANEGRALRLAYASDPAAVARVDAALTALGA